MVSDLVGEWVEWPELGDDGLERPLLGKVRAVYVDSICGGVMLLVETSGELHKVSTHRAKVIEAPQ